MRNVDIFHNDPYKEIVTEDIYIPHTGKIKGYYYTLRKNHYSTFTLYAWDRLRIFVRKHKEMVTKFNLEL